MSITVPVSGSSITVTGFGKPVVDALNAIVARKTADETVNNSATLQNDDELFVPLLASAVYVYDLHLIYNSGTTPDLKLGWSVPSGTTMLWECCACYDTTGTLVSTGNFTASTVAGFGGTGSDAHAYLSGQIVTSTTAGNVQLQWAQNSATGSNTIMRAGSRFIVKQVA
jgi:hypothetical protein